MTQSTTPRTDAAWAKWCQFGQATTLRDESGRLESELSQMTADRDSWQRQNEERVADVLRIGAELERWKEVARRLGVAGYHSPTCRRMMYPAACDCGRDAALDEWEKLKGER